MPSWEDADNDPTIGQSGDDGARSFGEHRRSQERVKKRPGGLKDLLLPQDRPPETRSATLRTIPQDNAFIIPMTIPELNPSSIPALIDTGASDCFIDSSLVRDDPRLISLSPPLLLTLFDGKETSSGKLTHAFAHTVVLPGGITRPVVSYVTTLHPSTKLVLGLSWLTAENALIDLSSRTVSLRHPSVPTPVDDLDVDPVDPLTIPSVDIENKYSPDYESGPYDTLEESDHGSYAESESSDDSVDSLDEEPLSEDIGAEHGPIDIKIIGAAAFNLLQRRGTPTGMFTPTPSQSPNPATRPAPALT